VFAPSVTAAPGAGKEFEPNSFEKRQKRLEKENLKPVIEARSRDPKFLLQDRSQELAE